MSGFEIMGIVLGAIPLFISAAEHYRDGLDTVDKFLKKERILHLYIQELETHQSLLRLQLQTVIGSTSLPAKIQQELVDNTISPLWQRQDVQDQLRQSLGDTTDILQKTMKRMVSVFIEQIDTDATISGYYQYRLDKAQSLRLMITQSQDSKLSWLKSFSDRVKFTWKSPKHNEILIDLKTCNDNLFKLINAIEEARPYQKKQQVRKVHAAWQSRIECQRLFDVLTSTCICSCQPSHRAKLRIKPCTNDDDEHLEYRSMLFEISFQQTLKCESAITVKMYRRRSDGQSTSVRIAVAEAPSAPDKTGWKAINNICSAVEAAKNANKHITLTIDELKDLWETEAPPIRKSLPPNPNLSLEALFPVFAAFANKRWLIREKLILAVISAYSTLQLHDSPWLQSGLSPRQIFFSEHCAKFSAATAAEAGNALGQPYISGDIWGTPQPLSTPSYIHRNPNLLSLGIMLLELHLNRSIQSYNTDQAAVKYQAIDLLQDQYDDCSLSPCYYEAIRFCLFPKPDPSTRLIDFHDQGFREMYYRNVVLPLEEELYQNFDIDQKFWDDL